MKSRRMSRFVAAIVVVAAVSLLVSDADAGGGEGKTYVRTHFLLQIVLAASGPLVSDLARTSRPRPRPFLPLFRPSVRPYIRPLGQKRLCAARSRRYTIPPVFSSHTADAPYFLPKRPSQGLPD